MGVVPIDWSVNWSMSLHLSVFINHCYIRHLPFYLWFHSCIVWWQDVAVRATVGEELKLSYNWWRRLWQRRFWPPPSNNPDEVLTESSVPYRLVKWLTELKCWGQRLFDRVSPFLYIRKSMPCIGHKLSDQIRQWRKVTFEKCLDARLCKEFSAFCGSSTLLCCPLRPTTFFWLAQFRHSNSACLRSNKIQWYLG